jgi:hypothetical protein
MILHTGSSWRLGHVPRTLIYKPNYRHSWISAWFSGSWGQSCLEPLKYPALGQVLVLLQTGVQGCTTQWQSDEEIRHKATIGQSEAINNPMNWGTNDPSSQVPGNINETKLKERHVSNSYLLRDLKWKNHMPDLGGDFLLKPELKFYISQRAINIW